MSLKSIALHFFILVSYWNNIFKTAFTFFWNKSYNIKTKFRKLFAKHTRTRIYELSKWKSHLVFFRSSRTFERACATSRAPFATLTEKEEEGREKRERERVDYFRKRNTSETPRARERGGKNRDANLPSRRWGQLCANAIPFSQVTRKTGHPPWSPYKEWCPVSLSFPPSRLPTPCHTRRAYAAL